MSCDDRAKSILNAVSDEGMKYGCLSSPAGMEPEKIPNEMTIDGTTLRWNMHYQEWRVDIPGHQHWLSVGFDPSALERGEYSRAIIFNAPSIPKTSRRSRVRSVFRNLFGNFDRSAKGRKFFPLEWEITKERLLLMQNDWPGVSLLKKYKPMVTSGWDIPSHYLLCCRR